jgi:hypothetical protein
MKWETSKHLYPNYKAFRKAYRAWHYQQNKSKNNSNVLAKIREVKRRLVEYCGNKCAHCGNSYPDCVYDFHHIDPSSKEIGHNLRHRSYEKALIEVQKCLMLCSNCHRIEHYRLKGEVECN